MIWDPNKCKELGRCTYLDSSVSRPPPSSVASNQRNIFLQGSFLSLFAAMTESYANSTCVPLSFPLSLWMTDKQTCTLTDRHTELRSMTCVLENRCSDNNNSNSDDNTIVFSTRKNSPQATNDLFFVALPIRSKFARLLRVINFFFSFIQAQNPAIQT